ncbi:NAD-dependent deacylase [Luteolibacter sp. GHJ8]|uniref:NAD-dependent protein deacylase n=1 Tax=Luteolibacter rhizosphaerae TaxID=2989719 RepID=A0ABT3G8C9_9BACT|nr:NAD-dependent deacylase [Luteolibacter rhizosphaerae]MCW1915719.1 NAD-dependent deacylase [Luteolibacter rhizosphaerae]
MKVVVLTGAGISAESGIRTFRDSNGLWEGHSVDQVATRIGFGRDPGLVNRFYNQRRQQLGVVQPNAAHRALGELENALADDFLLITQNVDDLHERAGSVRLIHMHGELLNKRCIWCSFVSPCAGDISPEDVCGKCSREMGMRPDVVWFGETPYGLDRIQAAVTECDLFVAIGTSGLVEPASRLATKAKVYGARLVEINAADTARSAEFDECLRGPASQVVPQWVDGVLGGLRSS